MNPLWLLFLAQRSVLRLLFAAVILLLTRPGGWAVVVALILIAVKMLPATP